MEGDDDEMLTLEDECDALLGRGEENMSRIDGAFAGVRTSDEPCEAACGAPAKEDEMARVTARGMFVCMMSSMMAGMMALVTVSL